MRITRYFILAEDESSGEIGFTPLWVPQSSNFTASDNPRLLMHDMLEHRGCDTGKIHEEIMAFARMRLVRRYLERADFGHPDVSQGRELAAAWIEDTDMAWIKMPPDTGEVGWEHEAALERISDAFCDYVSSNKDEAEHSPHKDLEDLKSRVLGWLRIGHLDAIRRYRGEHGCGDLGVQVFSWAESNARRFSRMAAEEEQGTVLALSYDTERYMMTDRLYRANPETGRLPEWAGRRVARWRCL